MEAFRDRVAELLPFDQFQMFPKCAIDAVLFEKLVLVVFRRPGQPVQWAVVPDYATLHAGALQKMPIIIGKGYAEIPPGPDTPPFTPRPCD
jgi:hypothetical protein